MKNTLSEIVFVFDFDGVFVLNSDAIFKKQAWKVVLESVSPNYETLLLEASAQYGHSKAGGRLEIIKYILSKIDFPSASVDVQSKRMSKEFDEYVQTEIEREGLVAGSLELLDFLNARQAPCYLNSGTATSALQKSAKLLKITSYFNGVFGSTAEPVGGDKVTNLKYIAQRENVIKEAVVFIGDSYSDYEAASEYGCGFIGLNNVHNNWLRADQPFELAEDFTHLHEIIATYF